MVLLATPKTPDAAGGLTQSALWVVIARGWSVAASAALGFLLPRWFGENVAACGEVLLILSLVGMAGMFGSFGLPETMIRLVAARLAQQQSGAVRLLVLRCAQLLGWTTLTVAAGTALYFWLHGFQLFHLPANAVLAAVVGIAILALSWQMVAASILRGLHDVKWANLLSGGQIGGPIVVTCFLALLATLFMTLPAASVTSTRVGQMLLMALLGVTGLTFWRLWKTLPATSDSTLAAANVPTVSELALDALPIALSQIAAFCTLSADLWLVGRFFGTDDVAFYGSAKRLVLLLGIPDQLAVLTIIAVIPDLYTRGKIAELQRAIRQTTTFAFIPAIIAAAVLILLPEQVLGLAFGPQYKAAASVLIMLTLGQLTANYLGPCGYVLLMTGQRWTVLAITVVCGVGAIVFGYLGAYFGGLRGLAIAAASCAAAQILLEWLAARYLVGVWCHASPFALNTTANQDDSVLLRDEEPT